MLGTDRSIRVVRLDTSCFKILSLLIGAVGGNLLLLFRLLKQRYMLCMKQLWHAG